MSDDGDCCYPIRDTPPPRQEGMTRSEFRLLLLNGTADEAVEVYARQRETITRLEASLTASEAALEQIRQEYDHDHAVTIPDLVQRLKTSEAAKKWTREQAQLLLDCRNALTRDDTQEAYHHLRMCADTLTSNPYDHWIALEEIAQGPSTQRGRSRGMKFTITMKDPDGVYEGIKNAAEQSLAGNNLGESDMVELVGCRIEQIEEDLAAFLEFGEYINIEFDTDAGTATVLPANQQEAP